MIHILLLDNFGTPTGLSSFEYEGEYIPASNEFLLVEYPAIPFEKIIESWRVVDQQLIDVGNRPSQYHVFNYTTKQWEDPRTPETEWPLVRAKRDNLLAQTDWVTARAYERGEPVPQNYLIYRQALRDITNQSDPFNITWPVLENAQ